MRKLHMLAALLAMSACGGALAQSRSDPNYYFGNVPMQWHIDGGFSEPTGTTADNLQGGWTVGGGFTWQPLAFESVRTANGSGLQPFQRHQPADQPGQVQTQSYIYNGYATILGLDVNGVLNLPISYWGRAYLTAGIGGAWRHIVLNQGYGPAYGYPGYGCGPWWGYCGGGYFYHDTTHFQWNAGAGLEFALGRGTSLVRRGALRRDADQSFDHLRAHPLRLPILDRHGAVFRPRSPHCARRACVRSRRGSACGCGSTPGSLPPVHPHR